jgi:hypothetical protein
MVLMGSCFLGPGAGHLLVLLFVWHVLPVRQFMPADFCSDFNV